MSAATMWAAMQSAIAAVTPYQGNDPTASANYRAAVGLAMCGAIISEINTPLVWSSGADLQLDIGQSSKITASAATSIPLHIACGDGQIYEMEMVGTYTPVAAATHPYLQINNAVPATNSFTSEYTQGYGAATVTGGQLTATADGGLLIGFGASIQQGKYTFFTSTANKKSIVCARTQETTNGIRHVNLTGTHNDTTTVWLSFGTIILPNAWTGTITVTRKA